MQICDNCFNDEEMQNAVRNESVGEGVCDACGQTSAVTNISLFADFFEGLLGLFTPNASGQEVVKLIQSDWNMFATEEIGNAIVGYFLSVGISNNSSFVWEGYY